jgi:hypothetical protein
MDQRFSRYAIASISLALLVPVEFYANIRGITKELAPNLVSVVMIMTFLGAVIFGHMSRAQIRRSGYIRSGYATGSTGMILGYLYLAALSYFLLAVMKRPLP